MRHSLFKAFEREMTLGYQDLTGGKLEPAFIHFERAHILGQAKVVTHIRSHWGMLRVGMARKDRREILGQVVRIILSIPGSLFGLAPKGNTGGANVGMFKPMPIPEDLERIMSS